MYQLLGGKQIISKFVKRISKMENATFISSKAKEYAMS